MKQSKHSQDEDVSPWFISEDAQQSQMPQSRHRPPSRQVLTPSILLFRNRRHSRKKQREALKQKPAYLNCYHKTRREKIRESLHVRYVHLSQQKVENASVITPTNQTFSTQFGRKNHMKTGSGYLTLNKDFSANSEKWKKNAKSFFSRCNRGQKIMLPKIQICWI